MARVSRCGSRNFRNGPDVKNAAVPQNINVKADRTISPFMLSIALPIPALQNEIAITPKTLCLMGNIHVDPRS
jgi:hypothetical protein